MENNIRKAILFSSVLALFACPTHALIDIALTPNTPWDVGGTGVVDEVTGVPYVIQNNGEAVRINVKGTNTAAWHLSGAPGVNAFSMKWNTVGDKEAPNWESIYSVDTNMFSSLTAGQSQNFYLRYQSPRYISESVGTQTSKVLLSAISEYIGAWVITPLTTVNECHPSMAIGPDNTKHITYHSDIGQRLLYAAWNGAAGTFSAQAVDLNGDPGRNSQVVADSENIPHIVYSSSDETRYVKWVGAGSQIISLGPTSNYYNASLALDAGNKPHVTYCDNSSGENVVTYKFFNGTEWINRPIGPGKDSSLKLDSNGGPHVAYAGADGIHYAKWDTGTNAWVDQLVEALSNVQSPSLAIGSDNKPYIAYSTNENELKYATVAQNGIWGSSLLPAPQGAEAPALLIDNNGYANIAYSTTMSVGLRAVRWTGTEWLESIIDDVDNGPNPAFKFDTDGKRIVVYGANYTLKSAVWQ